MWPMPSGKPGCVRSNAWHCDFSSQHKTSALSGGLRYSPMTSQNFSSKRLSFDSLKVRARCGLKSLAAHRRCTLAGEIPAARAIVRELDLLTNHNQLPQSARQYIIRTQPCNAVLEMAH